MTLNGPEFQSKSWGVLVKRGTLLFVVKHVGNAMQCALCLEAQSGHSRIKGSKVDGGESFIWPREAGISLTPVDSPFRSGKLPNTLGEPWAVTVGPPEVCSSWETKKRRERPLEVCSSSLSYSWLVSKAVICVFHRLYLTFFFFLISVCWLVTKLWITCLSPFVNTCDIPSLGTLLFLNAKIIY